MTTTRFEGTVLRHHGGNINGANVFYSDLQNLFNSRIKFGVTAEDEGNQ